MFEKIIEASTRRAGLSIVVVLAAAVLGVFAFREVNRDVFPDLSAPLFNVIVQNSSMGSEELEMAIAVPFETALSGLPAVRRIRSTNQLGVAQITVEFEADADYQRSRQLVTERVAEMASDLPEGTESPLISSLTGRLNEIFEFTLEAEPGAADLMTLRDLAEFEVKNRLAAVPGVAAVERLGGYLREFQVQLDPDRMVARGITLGEVLHAVDGANKNVSGGFIVRGPMEWTVRAIGRAERVEDLRSTVVAIRETTPVLLGDVADVREAPAVRRGIAHRLAGEVVSCRLVKQFGADTVEVADAVRKTITEFEKSLPKGVHLRIVYDQSELVRSALGGVTRAIGIGAVFVVLVLFLLLGDARAALLVTLTLPLSIAIAGLPLSYFGIGLNTMTLGGLAIAVGILVDASIIVTENIVHRKDVLLGAKEVGRPIAFATLIVVAVFLPLFGMSGIEGRMYRPLAAAVVAAVAASLVLSLTLVPALSLRFLKPERPNAGEDVAIIRYIKSWYAPLLDRAMKHAGAVRLVSLAITIPLLALATFVKSDFMPSLDEGALLIQTMLPAEASLEEVDRLNHRVEDELRRFPEVVDVVRRTGRAERTEDPMPHTVSDVLVVLKPDRERSLDELEREMRAAITKVPGVSSMFTTPLGMRIDEGLGGTPADISVRIFGPKLERLGDLAERTESILRELEGLDDVRAERATGLPQLRIDVDRAAAARVGLTPGEVLEAVRIGMVGEEFPPIWVGEKRYALVVRLQDHRREDAASIRTLWIDGHDGARVPLGQVANIEESFGPGAIRREGGMRRIAVEATVTDGDLGGAAERIKKALESKLSADLAKEPGYFFDVGGRVESQERATRALIAAIAFAVLGVFILLYLALERLSDALVIIATIPDALVGGVLALLITGESWNVSSLVGLIGLFGIAVQNGMVLVTQTRGLIAEGRPFEEALREASIGRVRPKLMTAATAILGLLPLLVLNLHGTEIERPLAIVMTGGLITSTLFTLLALPTFYQFVHNLRRS